MKKENQSHARQDKTRHNITFLATNDRDRKEWRGPTHLFGAVHLHLLFDFFLGVVRMCEWVYIHMAEYIRVHKIKISKERKRYIDEK